MLRAGKQVDVKAVNIKSNGAYIIAPVIDLCGIKIRCDKPTPEVIKQFFASMGADVGRIRYKGELLARVRGDYELHLAIIESFIKENQALVDEHNSGADTIPSSQIIMEELKQEHLEQNKPITFLFGNKPISRPLQAGISCGSDTILEVGSYSMRGKLFAKGGIFINSRTKQEIFSAAKYEDAPIGLMSHMAARDILLTSPDIAINDGRIEALSCLTLDSSEALKLSLAQGVDWVNSPHPETNSIRCTERIRIGM